MYPGPVTVTLNDELDFVFATFERALGLGARLPALPPDAPREVFSRDVELAGEHIAHAAAFRAALLEPEPPVEVLRASALGAYAAVRHAHELRKPLAEPGEPLPFDDEDRALAGIG